MSLCVCDSKPWKTPLAPYRSLSAPSGPKSPKSLRKSFVGPSGPGVEKVSEPVSKESPESQNRQFWDSGDAFLFRALFRPRARKARKTLRGFRARRGRETPVRDGRGPNPRRNLEDQTQARKRHINFQHINSLNRQFNPGTTSWWTRRKRLFSWVRRRTHKRFCPVNRPIVPGSTGPWPEQKVYVYVPFSLFLITALNKASKFNKLKTTPTPNKNGSYGIKGGVCMPYFWARMP